MLTDKKLPQFFWGQLSFQHIITFIFVCSFSLLELIWSENAVRGNLACQFCPFLAKNSIRYYNMVTKNVAGRSCGKNLKLFFLKRTSVFRCGLSGWIFRSRQNTWYNVLGLSVLNRWARRTWLGNLFEILRNSAINPILDLLNSGIFIGIWLFW